MPDETATILLNGNSYVVKLPIRHYDVAVQTEPFRTTGAFLRINNPKLEPYAFNEWRRGFGTRLVRPGHPEDRDGFFDATVLTIWKQAITLPILLADITDVSNYFITCSALYNGALWVAWSSINSGTRSNVVARSAGSSWSGGGDISGSATGGSVMAVDMIAADKLYCLEVDFPNDDHLVRYSSDGVTWTAPATTPITVDLYLRAPGMPEAWDAGRLAFDGVRIVAILHATEATTTMIKTFSSTNGGDTWAETTGCRFNTGVTGGVTGAVAYLDTDDTINIYVATRDVLKMIDIAAGTQTTILTFNGNAHNGRRMTVHNGSLYVPIDNGADAPFGMKKITISNGGRIIEDVGLDITQGIPSSMLGNIRWMRSVGPFLFASVGGDGASRTSRILAITGLLGDGWQNVDGGLVSGNRRMPWFDFLGVDMYQQADGDGLDSQGDTWRNLNLLAPPNSGVTFSYRTTADLELPEFGGDAPSEDGAFFQVQVEASDLVDSAEIIDFEYGLNGAVATTAGPTLNATNRRQALGTSSRGLSARTMRPNLEFNRGGTAGNTPKLREFVLLFRKNPAHLHGWEFEIDVEATKQLDRGPTSIYDELETIDHLDTLVPFVEHQALGEVQVEMVAIERLDWIRGGELDRQNARLEGTIKVRIEEVLAH